MAFIKQFTATTAICAALASPAYADITADDIWDGLQSYYSALGYQIATTNVAKDGNTLTIDNFALSMEIPEEDETLKISGISLVMEELANGTVDIQLPSEMTIQAEVEDVIVDVLLTSTDLSIIASGDPEDVSYDMSAASYVIDLKQIREGDVAFLPKVVATLKDIKSGMRVTTGDMTAFTQDFTSASFDLDIDVKAPEGDEQFKTSLNLTGISGEGSSTVPQNVDMEKIAEALAQGMKSDAKFGYNSATFDVSIIDQQDGADISGTSQSGSFSFILSEDGMGYSTGSSNTDLTIVPAAMPLQLKMKIAETASDFLFPISQSDTPQDARIMVKYEGLSLDDGIWGMFDPAAILPRTPATVLLDLSAKLSWDLDIFDPENAAALEGDSFPGKLYSAEINEVRLEAAGAEFKGDGAFTFDNDDLETFDGLPAPEGAINMSLKGGNGLLDKLIQMGFVSEDDAMGIRMMSGLFSNAGPGEDELVSKIEVKSNGNVLANGTRIK